MSRPRLVHCSLSLLLLALVQAGPAAAQPSLEFIPVQAPAPKNPADGPQPKAETPKAETPKYAGQKAAAPNVEAPSPEAPKFEPLVSAALGDTSFAAGAPAMIGDFGAILIRRTVLVPTFTTITTTNTTTFVNPEKPPPLIVTTTTTTRVPVTVPITIYVPVAGRDGSGFKIADGESPVPTDRVFFTWNGFDDLSSRSGSFSGSSSSTSSTTRPVRVDLGGFVFNASTSNSVQSVTAPITLRPTGDLNREIFGFEKTFLSGNASIEVRAPIYEGSGDLGGDFNGNHFGDMTAVFKYALLRDPEGLTFSAGLATTFPTGQGIDLDAGTLRSFLFQPFVGYLYRFGDAYVQGFTSVILPTSSGDPDLMFNDVGFGYQFYKGRRGDLVRSIGSVFEVHVTTPLDDRGTNSEISVSDIVSLTGGLHLGIGERAFLSFGLNTPLTGPRPYAIEAIVNFDYRF